MCEFCGCGLGSATNLPVSEREAPKALADIPIVALAVPEKTQAKQINMKSTNSRGQEIDS